jgi:hypothetical protein
MALDTGHLHLWYQILDKRKIEDQLGGTISGTGGDRDLTYPVGSGSLNIGDCAYLTNSQQW